MGKIIDGWRESIKRRQDNKHAEAMARGGMSNMAFARVQNTAQRANTRNIRSDNRTNVRNQRTAAGGNLFQGLKGMGEGVASIFAPRGQGGEYPMPYFQAGFSQPSQMPRQYTPDYEENQAHLYAGADFANSSYDNDGAGNVFSSLIDLITNNAIYIVGIYIIYMFVKPKKKGYNK